ncbi:hypothetical protein [Psychrobacter sp. I-STPA10]|uniref:hypothetical protein n=1 Tax=Psychrobacter sp. I-STPA10 TaxID=2585769 RepID=UPI001E49C51A|nr:hypothetical protein [Psychrobacter sp. I-STPA10]
MSDFVAIINHSHKANELERAMASLFDNLISQHLDSELQDLFDYGAPWQGSRTVVERFTKLDGLVVLRRDDGGLSDKIMSIIYANWSALASERGLGFLQFVLDMLYPQQNEIVRLWHSKRFAAQYPNYLKETQSNDVFLTSRIRIKLDAQVDITELSELTPILTRLVPWQIVPEIAISFNTQTSGLGVALAGQRFHVGNFSPF